MRVLLSLLTVFTFIFVAGLPAADLPKEALDWSGFLARSDLVWNSNPTAWEDAAFIGNGKLGASIYLQEGALAWEINRSDVSHGASRYPMGHFSVTTTGHLLSGNVRLDLWNAEARGVLKTDRGSVRWRSFAATTPSVIVIELEGDGDEANLSWSPSKALPPSDVYRKQATPSENIHPAAVVERTPTGMTSTQRFNGGGAFVVALQTVQSTAQKKIFFLTVGSGEDAAPALAESAHSLEQATRLGAEKVAEGHRGWWHTYYPESFLSIPDARLESFYWIQIYKLGSAMRSDGPPLDLMGPWFRSTPWPRIWWNLNIQLTYSPLFTANRLDLAESLFGALDRGKAKLIANVPPALRPNAAVIGRSTGYDLVKSINLSDTKRSDAGSEAGNLPWTLYYYWEYARYLMDDSVLKNRVFPLLRLAINHYLAYLITAPDGTLHLPPTLSPELAVAPDTNYDLALLRWGCETLVETAERLKIDDPLLPRWHEVLAHLTPYPTDATGLMIGRDRPLRESHRHYSHLLAIYPLHLITPEKPQDRELIEKSLAHWTSMPEKFRGFSYTGSASIYALLENGDKAIGYLHQLLDKVIKPNTSYTEAGPVIETPLSAATSLQEMLLQSWGGKLRVFPAIPSSWPDVSFKTLRGEGAFLVTAVRHGGHTAWIRIESQAGAPCHIIVRDWNQAVVRAASAANPPPVESVGKNEFTVSLAQGEWVLLTPSADGVLPELAPVAPLSAGQNLYPEHFR